MLEHLTGPPKTANQPQALAPCRRDLQVRTNATQGNEGELRAPKPQFLEVQPICKTPIYRQDPNVLQLVGNVSDRRIEVTLWLTLRG